MKDIPVKKPMRGGSPVIRCLAAVVLTMLLVFAARDPSPGYILPAEQIIGFMVANFSEYKTQVIVQSTQRKDPQSQLEAPVIREKIWAKSPNLFTSQVLEDGRERGGTPDMAFRQLLVANSPQRIMDLLRDMGVDLRKVAFSRFQETVVYRIGDREENSPKILIEKDRFLPLFLQYGSAGGNSGGMTRVELRDYRKVDNGWYPFEVSCRTASGVQEIYTLETMETNVAVDISVFMGSEERRHSGPSPPQGTETKPSEEERLRHIIKTFEEKYR